MNGQPHLNPDRSDWRPAASLAMLRLRARILARIRAFFAEKEVLEVDTPILSSAAVTDPHLESFSTRFTGPGAAHGRTLYLHTSPEFPMKRLLAQGSGAIYQICKVFRQGEAGTRHNPEFTMLEWYRPGFDHRNMMDEVESLLMAVLGEELDLAPVQRLTYAEIFLEYAGIEPHGAGVTELQACAECHGITALPFLGSDKDAWLDLLLTHVVEPRLGRGGITFVYEYPASQAALARVRQGTPPVAERFEAYLEGVELANGFHELADAREQEERFERDLESRRKSGLPQIPMDRRLLAALASGLPDCAGVALGVDRLLMMAAQAACIQDVLAFPVDRA